MTVIAELNGSYFDGQVTAGDIGILPTFDRVQSAEDEATLKRSTFGDTFSNNAETPTPFEVSADSTLTITIAKGSGYAAGYFGALLEDTTFSVPPNLSGANQVHGIFFRTDINNSVRRCQLVFKENDITEIKDIGVQSIQELRIAQISMTNGALVVEPEDVTNSRDYWRNENNRDGTWEVVDQYSNISTGDTTRQISDFGEYDEYMIYCGTDAIASSSMAHTPLFCTAGQLTELVPDPIPQTNLSYITIGGNPVRRKLLVGSTGLITLSEFVDTSQGSFAFTSITICGRNLIK